MVASYLARHEGMKSPLSRRWRGQARLASALEH